MRLFKASHGHVIFTFVDGKLLYFANSIKISYMSKPMRLGEHGGSPPNMPVQPAATVLPQSHKKSHPKSRVAL